MFRMLIAVGRMLLDRILLILSLNERLALLCFCSNERRGGVILCAVIRTQDWSTQERYGTQFGCEDSTAQTA
jgi:hypothetical protein